MTGKTHPLHGQDRSIVDQLLQTTAPDAQQITDAGRLLIRYDGYPGAYDIQQDLQRCLIRWQMSRDDLNARCRSIWAGGWRPSVVDGQEIGSGADVNAA